jgi:capsular exopolysaccharide synthesis family protein
VPQVQTNSEPDLAHYGVVLRRRRWMIALLVLLAVASAGVLSLLDTAQYEATTKVLVKNPPSSLGTSTGDAMTPRALANELERANSESVVAVAQQQVGPEPRMSAHSTKESDVFSFTAGSANASLAASASQLHAQAFLDDGLASVLAEYQASIDLLQRRVDETQRHLSELQQQQQSAIDAVPADAADRLQQLANIQAQYRDDIQGAELQRQNFAAQLESQKTLAELATTSGSQIIDAAVEPDSPITPNIPRNMLLSFIVALIVGIGLALVLDHFDTKLRNDEQLLAITGLGTLAGIPMLKGWTSKGTAHLITREDPQSTSAEAYRGLRTSLSFLSVDKALGVLQFTSAVQGEGKSTTAANLAVVMARAGQQVVLLDCDLRRPRLHQFFSLPNDVGFTDLLLGHAAFETAAQKVVGEEGLSVITSGPIPPDPSELLSSKRARDLIEQLRASADLVIIDSPPVLAVSDPLVLANLVDGVVLVVAVGKSDKRFIGRAIEQLQLVEARVVGTVLNRLGSRGSDSYGYGAGYGYGYGYRSDYKSTSAPMQPRRVVAPSAASDPVAELDAALAQVSMPVEPAVPIVPDAPGPVVDGDSTPPEIS